MNCEHCIYLEKDKPLNERRCTNEDALKPSKKYKNGVEGDKKFLHEDDISNKKKGMKNKNESLRKFWENEKIKPINSYFLCDYFKSINDV
jgi:hypothetical protein